jgi:hypothetical protein
VTKDVLGFSADLNTEVSLAKSKVMERTISFADILDDSYMSALDDDTFNSLRFVLMTFRLSSLKKGIVQKYNALGNETSAEQIEQLRSYVEQEFVPFSQDPDLQELYAMLDNPTATYSDFEDNGLFYWFAEERRLTFLYNSESIFSRQMSIVLRHTVFFKHITQLSLKGILFIRTEAESSSTMEHLYMNRESDTIPRSNAIRYGLIGDFIQSRQEFREKRLKEFQD